MNWNSAADFFAMGGYGLYVWGSYAMALVLMAAEPLLARRRLRDALRHAAAQMRRAGAPR
ncbi:MAG TPA: heme exporter protein CcmD [Burkholderiaceae bacterium]|nr:heme exporter protein CcmD [Burkholderiaceae bacterium]